MIRRSCIHGIKLFYCIILFSCVPFSFGYTYSDYYYYDGFGTYSGLYRSGVYVSAYHQSGNIFSQYLNLTNVNMQDVVYNSKIGSADLDYNISGFGISTGYTMGIMSFGYFSFGVLVDTSGEIASGNGIQYNYFDEYNNQNHILISSLKTMYYAADMSFATRFGAYFSPYLRGTLGIEKYQFTDSVGLNEVKLYPLTLEGAIGCTFYVTDMILPFVQFNYRYSYEYDAPKDVTVTSVSQNTRVSDLFLGLDRASSYKVQVGLRLLF
ncbi:MAG: hypothetical protein P857_588 [Candidatus Xenolissoclinum pacificiensis L6]|uniref:Uncharacterized protein n=1 Tax=Candidatus Xenolissoclinum pacificiensis L6 TaxID=1401685 RepID=W2V0C2_9RICK|nr:MAG: hypothetical protein P857_588 [Candidatus Xenolissoclinum pacificiensis L6]